MLGDMIISTNRQPREIHTLCTASAKTAQLVVPTTMQTYTQAKHSECSTSSSFNRRLRVRRFLCLCSPNLSRPLRNRFSRPTLANRISGSASVDTCHRHASNSKTRYGLCYRYSRLGNHWSYILAILDFFRTEYVSAVLTTATPNMVLQRDVLSFAFPGCRQAIRNSSAPEHRC